MKKIDCLFDIKKLLFAIAIILLFTPNALLSQITCNAVTEAVPESNDIVFIEAEDVIFNGYQINTSYFHTITDQSGNLIRNGINSIPLLNGSQYFGQTLIDTITGPGGNKCWGELKIVPFKSFGCTGEYFTISPDPNDEIRITPNMILNSPYDPSQTTTLELQYGTTTYATGTNEVILTNASNYFGAMAVTITEVSSGQSCTDFFSIVNPNPGYFTCSSTFSVTPDSNCMVSFSPLDYTTGFNTANGLLGVIHDNSGNQIYDFNDYFFNVDVSNLSDYEWTATTLDANVGDTCSTRIVILDNTAPDLVCADMTGVQIIGGANYSVGRFVDSASDICGGVSLTAYILDDNGMPLDTPKSRLSMLPGIDTFDIVVRATDLHGNYSECTTEVITWISTNTDLRCNTLINYSTDEDCEVVFRPDHWIEGFPPPGNYEMEITTPDGFTIVGIDSIHFINAGDYLNTLISYNITNVLSLKSCSGELMLEDKLDPEMECLDTIQVTSSPNPFDIYELFPSEVDNGITDNCQLSSILIAETDGNGNPMTPPENSVLIPRWLGFLTQVMVTATDASGNSAECTAIVEVIDGGLVMKNVDGFVFEDTDADCTKTGTEIGLGGWNLAVVTYPSNEITNVQSDFDGSYSLMHIYPGTDTLMKVFLLSPMNLTGACPNTFCVDLNTAGNTVSNDFAIQMQALISQNCPNLRVDIAGGVTEKCKTTEYVVNYCNYSTEDEASAKIEVTLDDDLTVISSDLPWTSANGNTYGFEPGLVKKADCGSFKIKVEVDCDAELTQAHFAKAKVTSAEFCTPNDPNWSGASVEVKGECIGDSIVFTIKNVGDEDMIEPRNFIVIEDVILHKQASFDLLAQAELRFAAHGKGNTCRLEAEQVPGHPGNSFPSVTVEGCGIKPDGSVSRGFYTQFPQDDADFFQSVDVLETGKSKDLEILALPKGVEAQRFIKNNTDIEYLIRFRNTTGGVIQNAVVTIVNPEELNLSTLFPGSSSHNYRYEVSEFGEASFVFNNMNLKTNELVFVNYRISQKNDLDDGIMIQTSAMVSLDGLDTAPTNVFSHEVNSDFLKVSSIVNLQKNVQLSVGPNPFINNTTFRLKGVENQPLTLNITDINGKIIREETFYSDTYEFKRNGLPQGVYFFKIISEKGISIATGKIVGL